MTQTSNRILDELARLITNAAGAAHSARSEIDSILRGQVERAINDLELVRREEFEAVREMAVKARAQNEALEARLAVLEKAAKPARKPRAKKPAKPSSRPSRAK